MTQDYRVLLYYQYVTIENGEQFAKEHLAACKNLGIKGRILVADEGINGTVSGSFEQTEAPGAAAAVAARRAGGSRRRPPGRAARSRRRRCRGPAG